MGDGVSGYLGVCWWEGLGSDGVKEKGTARHMSYAPVHLAAVLSYLVTFRYGELYL